VRLLREYYSVPFRMGFVEGGARCFMASYNAWNGVPLTVHPILEDLTAKEWGVDGIICTDAGSLGNLVRQHKAYPEMARAAAASIKAGINMFLAIFEDYEGAVRTALAEGRLAEPDIDAVLRGSLRVAFRLGLLDPPALVPYSKLKGAPDPVNSPEHNAVARQVARESIVLLKNSAGLLPLDSKRLRSVAVVGALADVVLPDFYGGTPPYTVTPLAAIKSRLGPAVKVTYVADDEHGAAAAAARPADVAIVVVGNHPTCGRTPAELIGGLIQNAPCADPSENMEGADRSSLGLTPERLVRDVHAANPRTVVVLVSSAPYAINWTQANVPAILHASHNGQEEGTAIADVLFGNYNPAGRPVQTWVRSVDQLPPMMDYDLRHGRTYMYFTGEPLYPFGYGLSYTTFAYTGLKTSASRMGPDGEITVSLNVKNTSRRTGDEVVQLYVRHEGSKVERPRQELRAFERVGLGAGETKTVRMTLKADSLAYWDEKAARFVVEDEPVRLMIGGSSSDVRLETTVTVSR
jgi:beta-glucosidase